MARGNDVKYVRRDCINAVGAFMEKVKGLRYADVSLEGRYMSDRNRFLDPSQKEQKSALDRGTKLGIVLGGGDRDRTCYAFELRDPSSKDNAKLRSLRFKSVTAATSRGNGINDASRDALAEKLLMRSTSRAANSMSFGAMFNGAMGEIMARSSEEKAVLHVRDVRGAKGWDGVRGELCSDDPLHAMAAWEEMASQLDGKVDPSDPRMTRMATQAMGLDALYDALEALDRKMAKEPGCRPDLAEALDPETPEGRRALRGVMCLSAYKSIRDRGGLDVVDEHGTEVVGVTRDNYQVFDRMAYTRADAERRAEALASVEASRDGIVPIRCVQKTFAGIQGGTGSAPEKRIDRHMQYRFFRSAVLGEDPDMPSGMPKMRLMPREGADMERLSGSDIMAWMPGVKSGPSLAPFMGVVGAALDNPNGPYGQMLRDMPAMKAMAARPGGADALENLAVSQIQAAGGEVDGALIEMAAFLDKANRKGMGRELRATQALCDDFQRNYQDRVSKAPNLMRSIEEAVGRPEFSAGCASFGHCWLADMSDTGAVPEQPAPGECDSGSGSSIGRSASAFMTEDAKRRYALKYTKQEAGVDAASMDEVEASLQARSAPSIYKAMLSDCMAAQKDDPVRGSMMLNDAIVLTSCYNAYDAYGLDIVKGDLKAAYDGGEPRLYRPVDRAQDAAMGEVYKQAGGGALEMAMSGLQSRNGTDAFLDAAWRGAEAIGRGLPDTEPGDLLERAAAKMEAAALDLDTFQDRRNAYLADRLVGPKLSEKVFQMELEAGGKPLDKDRDHSIV